MNITNTYTSQHRTGIQRVVVNLCRHLIKNHQYIPITFDQKNNTFMHVKNFKNIDSAIYGFARRTPKSAQSEI